MFFEQVEKELSDGQPWEVRSIYLGSEESERFDSQKAQHFWILDIGFWQDLASVLISFKEAKN